MPKDTFFNLPQKKQSLIIDVVITEFYEKGYDLASISSIVEKAHIAKGSFYQYFDGKDELFKYINTMINDKKMQFAQPVILVFEQLSFYDWFKQMLKASFNFLRSYPILAKISIDFWKHSSTNIKECILGDEIHRTQEFLAIYIKKAVERNELRNDISIEYLTHFLSNQLAFFTDYILDSYEDLSTVSESNLEKLLTNFIGLLEYGTTSGSK